MAMRLNNVDDSAPRRRASCALLRLLLLAASQASAGGRRTQPASKARACAACRLLAHHGLARSLAQATRARGKRLSYYVHKMNTLYSYRIRHLNSCSCGLSLLPFKGEPGKGLNSTFLEEFKHWTAPLDLTSATHH